MMCPECRLTFDDGVGHIRTKHGPKAVSDLIIERAKQFTEKSVWRPIREDRRNR